MAPVVNSPVQIDATVISLIGSDLDFEWVITGGNYTDLDNNDNSCTFTPTDPGEFTITMTATDSFGASKSTSIQVTVTDIDIRVSDFEIVSEEFYDTKLNPGETVQVKFFIENLAQDEVTGNVYLEGTPGVIVPDNGSWNVMALDITNILQLLLYQLISPKKMLKLHLILIRPMNQDSM